MESDGQKHLICCICNTKLYEEDGDDPHFLRLGDDGWLTIMTKCVKCGRNGCKECLSVCYTCSYGKDLNEPIATCHECCDFSTFKQTNCKYHDWANCRKHRDKGCGQCSANKNYDSKMG
jgi:hypothetical protein